MFLRKTLVFLLPLLMAAGLIFLFPVLGGAAQDKFLLSAICGALIGLMLFLSAQTSGSKRNHDPFAGFMLSSSIVLFALLLVQYLVYRNLLTAPFLSFLSVSSVYAPVMESAAAVFLLLSAMRGIKR
ncbi:MAG: hypothetical protein PHI27_12355 [Eubacteriales bacterium]|nr:hypothetical protein [Eubacteriales bacterium]MDD3883014.1 hypothetical protein [Eubacteriales bacterium]MDD4513659.1 hypothetical protein [Eubacteriales bacterium]